MVYVVWGEQFVEFGQDLFVCYCFGVQGDSFVFDEFQCYGQCFGWLFVVWCVLVVGVFVWGFLMVDFVIGYGQVEQVFVDGVGLLFGVYVEIVFFQVFLFVGVGLGVFFLDFVDWCDDLVVVQCFYGQVEVDLVVVYVGVVVGDDVGVQFGGVFECGIYDQVVVGYQQWVLVLVVFVGLYEWFDEVVLDCWIVIDGDVVGYVQFGGVFFDEIMFFVIYVVGVGEYGVYVVVVFLQVRYVEVGVEFVGEGQDDVFFVYGGLILQCWIWFGGG